MLHHTAASIGLYTLLIYFEVLTRFNYYLRVAPPGLWGGEGFVGGGIEGRKPFLSRRKGYLFVGGGYGCGIGILRSVAGYLGLGLVFV